MTIPRNKNLTKQLNSYSYVIAITLQGLLQRTKRALSFRDQSMYLAQTKLMNYFVDGKNR